MIEPRFDPSATLPSDVARSINYAAGAAALLLGCRLELLSALSALGTTSAHQVARATGVSVAHVAEWLRALVALGLATETEAGEHFTLAGGLVRVAKDKTLLAELQGYLEATRVLWSLVDDVELSFRSGKGIDPARFRAFELMLEAEGADSFPTVIPALVRQAEELHLKLSAGARVADLGCGSGGAALTLGPLYPNSHFFGIDASASALNDARNAAIALNLQNVSFSRANLSELSVQGEYDLVLAIGILHEIPNLADFVRRVASALTRTGILICTEMDLGSRTVAEFEAYLRTLSMMHCVAVSLHFGGEGHGLFLGEEAISQALAVAGFAAQRVCRLANDPGRFHVIAHLNAD